MTGKVAASLPLAIVALHLTAVAVLLPDIRLDLGSSPSGAQWVLNAYLLALAALFPLLAPLRGRGLAIAGALVMAAGAIVSARAGSTAALVTGEALQGAGVAALLAPLGGSQAALGLPAVALAMGPLVGGFFAEQNWWHVFLWAGLPLAALAGAAALATQPERTAPQTPVAFAVGLTAVTVLFVQAEPWGLGWLGFAGAAVLAAVTGVVRRLPGAIVAWAVLAGCVASLLFLLPEYFQLVRNLSGLRSGVLLLALTLPAVTVPALFAFGGRKVADRAPLLAGAGCAVLGLAALFPIEPDTRYALVIGALGLTGTGFGLAAAGLRGAGPPGLGPLLAGATLVLAAAGAFFQLEQADERDAGASFEHALSAGVGGAAAMLIVVIAIAAVPLWQERRAARATPASSAARPAAGS